MRSWIFAFALSICCLMVITGFVGFSSAATSTTTTSTRHALVFQGHSPVDLFVKTPEGDIGCPSEPCTSGVNEIPGATFSGATGTGCGTESGPETITIPNPQPGTYNLTLFPSSTYFATSGSGCTTTILDPTFTITISDLNTLSYTNTVTTCTGSSCKAPIFNQVGTLASNGLISGFSSFTVISTGVPEFPLSVPVVIAITLVGLAAMRGLASRMRGISRK